MMYSPFSSGVYLALSLIYIRVCLRYFIVMLSGVHTYVPRPTVYELATTRDVLSTTK